MTECEKVRLLIGDSETTDYITDAEINAFLADNSLYKTCELCTLALANNQAFRAYMVRTMTYSSDNRAATELRAQAREFARLDTSEPAGGAAEQDLTDAVREMIVYNKTLRAGG